MAAAVTAMGRHTADAELQRCGCGALGRGSGVNEGKAVRKGAEKGAQGKRVPRALGKCVWGEPRGLLSFYVAA